MIPKEECEQGAEKEGIWALKEKQKKRECIGEWWRKIGGNWNPPYICALRTEKKAPYIFLNQNKNKTLRLCGPISAMAKNQHPPQPFTPSLPSRILSYSFSHSSTIVPSTQSHKKTITYSLTPCIFVFGIFFSSFLCFSFGSNSSFWKPDLTLVMVMGAWWGTGLWLFLVLL